MAEGLAPADLGLGPGDGRQLGPALLTLELGELGAEDLQRLGLVLVLAALVLHGDDDPRGQVREPYRRVGDVHVLAAGA